jgi:hypothetical protein
VVRSPVSKITLEREIREKKRLQSAICSSLTSIALTNQLLLMPDKK